MDQIVHRARAGAGVDFDVLEALIGENDLVEINYLERGLMAARTVCRINVAAMLGDGSEWGTGFLIGPRLLLTNNHVLPTAQDALRATVEFGYELDGEGRLRRTTRFQLTPQDGFITSPKDKLDYTIVAIAAVSEDGATPIADLGYLRLDPRTNKVDVGQYVTIIQHPDARTKRISLRENKVVKYGDDADPERDNFLWYSSDTAPGSSGAPVCTDAWQVVCLHHAGVPERRQVNGEEHWVLADGTTAPATLARKLPAERVHWLANEGVRISRLVADVEDQAKDTGAMPGSLIAAFVADATGAEAFAGTVAGQSIVGLPIITASAPATRLSLGSSDGFEAAKKPSRHTRPATYFDGRTGYDPDFLPTSVPLPTLGAGALAHGAPAKVAGAADDVLRYLHFSLVFNGDPKRKIAFFTAVNVDGARWTNLNRGKDTWYYDPRLPEELQNGDELYGGEPVPSKNYFDRGHLVRRLDPVWGDIREAAQANDDTFYWTNCSAQYWGFNEGADLWQGLENFLLYNTDEEDVRATVFSGPILRSDDEEHRGILIPQFFWKVIAVADKAGKLFTSAYIVSQQDYALNIPFERLPVGPNSTEPGQNFQVSVAKIETETGLIFPKAVRKADVFTGPQNGRALRSVADVEHPRR
ncbi:MAG: DNA/RNA non-specific endonuclease [Phenylobacterium sp.]|uniref:DNA/RNA non-specific endonuclease n=1 Tax=Phenylobacterium sp. TaxID=1871053 RepID=UPI0027182CD7|nr:DNA/RNA non-specific endonuclease [Phenylobacterium sp.]MDO8409390.1 DNA/RNA non-specific endonuclease [Phenylobacterium sp.]